MAYPPHKTLASVPVSQTIALKYLSSYLAATKTTPYVIPNARLEPTGPSAGLSGAPVQLRNLERVEAGLRGEYLAPVLELGDGENGGKADGLGHSGNGEAGEEWQDLSEYQREQSIEEGEVEPRPAALAQEGDEGFEERVEVEAEDEEEAPKAKKIKTKHGGGANGAKLIKEVDKKARKAAKKERAKEEKRRKQAENLKRKGAEE